MDGLIILRRKVAFFTDYGYFYDFLRYTTRKRTSLIYVRQAAWSTG